VKLFQDSVKAESGKDFLLSEKYGFLHSCPTNLGTGTTPAILMCNLDCLVKRRVSPKTICFEFFVALG